MARSALPHGGHSMEANNAARGPVVMHQRWRDLLFLHWDVPAEIVAHTLPTGLEVDAFEAKAWLGIVPFRMEGVRPRGLPAVPGISAFGELNLRTYVVGPDGTPGVWFYSLDAHQRLAVWLARKLFHLPYVWADIVPRRDGRRVRYAWSREGKADREKPSFVYDTPPDAGTTRAAPAEAGGLDVVGQQRGALGGDQQRGGPGVDGGVDVVVGAGGVPAEVAPAGQQHAVEVLAVEELLHPRL
ncbi:MAG: YqjF family protein, partial [Phycisphaeraceae bacterium]